MQAYTALPGVGQWISRAVETASFSQTATQPYLSYSVFALVWQPIPFVQSMPTLIDEHALAQLYDEFADEDRALANMGILDYARLLADEDKGA